MLTGKKQMSTNKRFARPWDKAGVRCRIPAAANKKLKPTENGTPPEEVPYVELDGIQFFSDRFYLNQSVHYRDDYLARVPQARRKRCSCGARNPPPLFDRSRLVESLELKAAILGTYSFDTAILRTEFPSLFGPSATVPTLLMHGKKGWNPEKKKQKSQRPEVEKEDIEDDEPDSEMALVHSAFEGECDQEVRCRATNSRTEEETPLKEKASNTNRWKGPVDCTKCFPSSVHFSEILPVWVPPEDVAAAKSKIKSDGQVDSKRIGSYRQGVHHPKFMLLFETSGSIVVVVSTGNFTRQSSTDASWLQRFPPAVENQNLLESQSQVDPSDFGAVLANFLHCETVATRDNQLTPLQFVRRNLGWKSLRNLQRKFDYTKAQAYLIPTVPGDYSGTRSQKRSKQMEDKKTASTFPRFLYGRQRVAHLLETLSSGSNPSLPRSLMTSQDRLVFQPTSFGAEWNERNMVDLVQSYLACSEDADSRSSSIFGKRTAPQIFSNQSVLGRLDIVWPTDRFIREADKGHRVEKKSPTGVIEDPFKFSPERDEEEVDLDKENEGHLFLSSETFNRIELACLSQMAMYEASSPIQQPRVLVPHFKSVLRLFEGNEYRLRKDFSAAKCEEYLSWFLLTSACLSRGAQGEETANRLPDSDSISYSNFELGVLFCSRLIDKRKALAEPKGNRLYCWKPAHCLCHTRSCTDGPAMIHLPIPYSLRGTRYQEDVDEADFCETPYFHEIPPGTGCVGNMKLTPYGAAVAKKYAKEGLQEVGKHHF